MRLGVHVPIAGGLLEAVARAKRLSCNTMQIFSRSPRGGPAPRLDPDLVARFHAERMAAGIDPLLVHGPYIINLASPDARMWKQSAALYEQEYARAAGLQAQYLVTHVGSHRGQGEVAGISRVAEAINAALALAKPTTMILLENTAGSGQGLGYAFEHLAAIRDRVEANAHVGICLDTAHLFAAGFPIHTPEGLDETLQAFDRIVGLEHVRAVHLNDSKVEFNSRVDRHWHIGEGKIGRDAFRRIVQDRRLNAVPLILETPKSTEADDVRNLGVVRSLASGGPHARRAAFAAAC
jgi:deoxyribonuclease-4